MNSKFLFITKDKKFYYDGKKIKEVKRLEDLGGVTIIFAKPMIVYDVQEIGLSYFEENFGNLVVGEHTVEKLINLLLSNDFIVYVDHERRQISVILESKGIISLPYNVLEFLRYFLAKLPRGILLESEEFQNLGSISHNL